MVPAQNALCPLRALVLSGVLLAAAAASAATRTSADYAITADTLTSGGQRTTSANATHDGSFGGVGGVSVGTSSSLTLKHGFVGQLRDEVGFTLSAGTPTVAEGATRQVAVALVMDDATMLPAPAAELAWSVLSGPLAINATGRVSAAAVFADAPGRLQGTRRGLSRSLDLTVLNTDPDNFQSYGGDGIDDDWQVNFFGTPPNALAGPGRDPDGDGQDNLYEFLGLLDPTDPASRLSLQLIPVPGAPLQRDLVFSPVFPTRNYTLESSPDLDPASFAPLTGTPANTSGTQRTLRHTLTTPEATRFYRIQISRE